MKPNVDRILRLIAGIAILGAGFYFKSWLGLIGIVPILTGLPAVGAQHLPNQGKISQGLRPA